MVAMTLSDFTRQYAPKLGGVPKAVKAFMQLVNQVGNPDPTKALVEISLDVPDDVLATFITGLCGDSADNELAEETATLTSDDLAALDAAMVEYDGLPLEVRTALTTLVVPPAVKKSSHTAKWKRCVEHVESKGRADVNAYAVCTAALGQGAYKKSVSDVALSMLAAAVKAASDSPYAFADDNARREAILAELRAGPKDVFKLSNKLRMTTVAIGALLEEMKQSGDVSMVGDTNKYQATKAFVPTSLNDHIVQEIRDSYDMGEAESVADIHRSVLLAVYELFKTSPQDAKYKQKLGALLDARGWKADIKIADETPMWELIGFVVDNGGSVGKQRIDDEFKNWRWLGTAIEDATDKGYLVSRGNNYQATPKARSEWTASVTGKSVAVPQPTDLIAYGGALKAMPDGVVMGCAVLFTDPSHKDLTGDYFTKATRFDWAGQERKPALYHHGMDKTVGLKRFGDGWELDHIDDIGLWVKTQLNMRDEYEAAVYGMTKSGKLGLSSGTASHMVERDVDGRLKSWSVSEISFTPTPAEPGTMVMAVKSIGATPTWEQMTTATKHNTVSLSPVAATIKSLSTLSSVDAERVATALELLGVKIKTTTKAVWIGQVDFRGDIEEIEVEAATEVEARKKVEQRLRDEYNPGGVIKRIVRGGHGSAGMWMSGKTVKSTGSLPGDVVEYILKNGPSPINKVSRGVQAEPSRIKRVLEFMTNFRAITVSGNTLSAGPRAREFMMNREYDKSLSDSRAFANQ